MSLMEVKGHIESRSYEQDGEKKYLTEIMAEKVTFLSSNNNKAEGA